ncbi:MAG: hypothetical protein IH595_10615 [Bacteroidales bacterium]|nr:hypothetical protein [Bacteroidales bacterium]
MKKNKLGLLVGLVFLAVSLNAQDINSPFSRFGLGRLYGEGVSTQQQSMGGIGLGFTDPFTINPSNPASYANFVSKSFVFQTGIIADFGSLSTTQNSQSYNYMTLGHVEIGFPVTNWWRSSFGVLPYSKTGYDILDNFNVSGFGNMTSERWGQGGLTRIYWGNGFKITKNLRVGVNVSYLFGNTRYYNIVYSPDSLEVFGTKTEQYLKVGNLLYDWGLQYDIHLKKGRVITLGAVYSNKVNVSANRYWLATSLTGGYGSTPADVRDTIQYVPSENGKLLIPAHYGIGFTYTQPGHWLVGADIDWQNWSQFRSFGQSDSLQQSFTIAVGGEYTPTHTTISRLGKRMSYRLGMRYQQSYLSLYGTSINEFAVTGGVKFPFKRNPSNLNVGFEIGSHGTLQNNLVKDGFFNLSFGINIVDLTWFIKPKYR